MEDKEQFEAYINQYAQALESVITESLEEFAATGSLPDLEHKLRSKQQQLGQCCITHRLSSHE